MAFPLPFRSRITGTGSYVPDKVVTNADLAALVDTSDEWISTRTGIKERRAIDPPMSMGTVDMAEHASHRALELAGLKATDLDLIIVATVTPDLRLPSAAALLQHRLGAVNAAGFDVVAACAGSLYGLTIADKFTSSGAARRVLVIGGEALTSITNWQDRNSCVLFGDAAGAAIVEQGPVDGGGLIDTKLYLDGTHWDTIMIPAGGSKQRMTPALLEAQADKIVMNGRETYKFAVRALVDASETILAKNGVTAGDVALVVAHQANLRIIEAVADRLSVPLDRFVINIDKYGNTSSASLLLTFDEARRQGRMKPGDLVLMLAIGSGMTWGAGLYRD